MLRRPEDNYIQFDHQLKHDYLASRHLVQDENRWDVGSFDALSFKSNSFEALTMAFDQIASRPQADKFVERVYDWNWGATPACIADAARGERRYSREIEVFVLAVVALKLFDPIHATRERAKEMLSALPSDVTAPFIRAKTIKEIIAFVRQIGSKEEWFLKWQELFTKPLGSALTEEDIELILEQDPKLGWTASNVIRLVQPTNADLRQLRAIYTACKGQESWNDTIRWRVVHALGAFATGENVVILFRALDKDPYLWARYGAARSLIEIAASTKEPHIRRSAIEGLKSRVQLMPAMIQDEIGRAVFHQDRPDTWETDVIELLQTLRDAQRNEPEKDRWDVTMMAFEKFLKGDIE